MRTWTAVVGLWFVGFGLGCAILPKAAEPKTPFDAWNMEPPSERWKPRVAEQGAQPGASAERTPVPQRTVETAPPGEFARHRTTASIDTPYWGGGGQVRIVPADREPAATPVEMRAAEDEAKREADAERRERLETRRAELEMMQATMAAQAAWDAVRRAHSEDAWETITPRRDDPETVGIPRPFSIYSLMPPAPAIPSYRRLYHPLPLESFGTGVGPSLRWSMPLSPMPVPLRPFDLE